MATMSRHFYCCMRRIPPVRGTTAIARTRANISTPAPTPIPTPNPTPTILIYPFAGSVIDIKRMLQVCSLGFVDEYLSEAAALYMGCFWAALGCISGFSGTEGGCPGAVPQSAALPYPGRSLMG